MRRIGISALALFGCTAAALDPMERQQRFGPYSENARFADRRSMRTPPEGTVPRERQLHAVHPGLDRDHVAAARIPVPVSRELLSLGRKRFDITCAACHGLLGDGESVVARNMALRPPPSLHVHHHHPPGFLFEVVSRGYGLMPALADEIPADERWAVVAYVRALQLSQAATLAQVSPDIRRKLEATK